MDTLEAMRKYVHKIEEDYEKKINEIEAAQRLKDKVIAELKNTQIKIETTAETATAEAGVLNGAFARGFMLLNDPFELSPISNAIERFQTQANPYWILTQADLLKLEGSLRNHDEVWVITADFENFDPVNGSFFDIVKNNINRGIQYHLFAPQNLIEMARAERIYSALNQTHQIRLHLLDEERFDLFFGWNVGIRIHRRDRAERLQDDAFIELKFREKIKWVTLDRKLTVELIESLKRFSETPII